MGKRNSEFYVKIIRKKREEFAKSAGPNKSQTNNDRKVRKNFFALNY